METTSPLAAAPAPLPPASSSSTHTRTKSQKLPTTSSSLYTRVFEACKQQFYKIDIGIPRGPDGRADFSRDPPESFKRIHTVTSIVRHRRPSSVAQLVMAVFESALRRFPKSIALMLVFSLMASAAGILKPKLIQLAVDLGVEAAKASSTHVMTSTWLQGSEITDTCEAVASSTDLIENSADSLLWNVSLLVVLFVLCSTIESLLKLTVLALVTFVATQVEDSWRYAGVLQFFSLPMAWHNERDSATVTSKIENGAGSVWTLVYEYLGEEVLVNLFTVICIMVSAIYTAPHLWWVFLLPLPIYVVLVHQADSFVRAEQKICRKSGRAADEALYDGTTNKQIVRSFGCEERETRRYASFWGAYHVDEYTETLVHLLRAGLQTSTEVVLHTLLVCLCLRDLLNGSMSVGTVAMLLSYQRMLFDPLMSFNRMLVQVARDMRKLGDLVKLLLVDDPLADKPDSVDLPALRHAITLKNVVFRYAADLPPPSSSSDNEGDQQAEASDNSNSSDTDTDSDVDTNNQVGDDNDDDDDETYSERERKTGISRPPALCAINISIPAGKTTAFVGRSGAGKSTLLQLLLRFFDPTEGSILWDGIDIAMSTRRSIRSRTAVVQQDCSLFNRSIRDNITYGCAEEVDEARVIEAATRANIHHFIETLPLGYDSVVGEKGVRLSGGQKQRLAIARALVLQPSLLILDESTSNLDSESERAIQYAIESLQHQVTQVIVAHRLSTILHADQIVVMDQGSVVGVGTHAELLVTCPEYRSLYVLQHGGDIKLSATTKECSNAVCA